MNYKETVEYLFNSTPVFEHVGATAYKDGLDNSHALDAHFGHPHTRYQTIHVAGTNGKGSSSHTLASILQADGHRVGLYTSPHLVDFRERIRVNGVMMPEEYVVDFVREERSFFEPLHPSFFELTTALAFKYFAEQEVDIAVVEVGLGGRLDCTNIITPQLSIITNISVDHTQFLGHTLPEIAYEKAGIIKEGSPVVMYQQYGEVMEVVRDVCAERNAELTVPDFDDIHPEFDSRDGQVFSYGGEAYAIPLLGEHQLKNAATVLETIGVLRRQGWQIEHEAIEAGLYAVSWPARFEIVHSEPWFVVDGGHNPQCAQALRASILEYFPDDKRVLLMGVLRDKDYKGIVQTLAPLFDAFVTVTPDTPRALPAAELAELFADTGKEVQVCSSIQEGVRTAMDIADKLEGMVCACGSLYICGDIRACFGLR